MQINELIEMDMGEAVDWLIENQDKYQIVEKGTEVEDGEVLPFDRWFRKLLTINVNHGEFGLDHPLGSCCYRDVLRHNKVQKALKKAWNDIIVQGSL